MALLTRLHAAAGVQGRRRGVSFPFCTLHKTVVLYGISDDIFFELTMQIVKAYTTVLSDSFGKKRVKSRVRWVCSISPAADR